MNNFDYPIASEPLLEKLIEQVIYKSYLNLHVTVNTFRGAGKPSELRYLFSNYTKIPNYRKDRVFLVLDIQSFEHAESAYKSSLAMLGTHFDFLLSDKVKGHLTELTSKDTLGLSEYLEFLHSLIDQENLNATVLIENFKFTYDGTEGGHKDIEIIESIRRLNTDRVSLIFINDREFSEDTPEVLGKLWAYVTSNMVWGGEMLFDQDSAMQAFENNEKKHGITFKSEFKQKVIRFVYGDPSALKRIIILGISSSEFCEAVAQTSEAGELINLMGEDWVDNRYKELLFNLAPTSLETIINGNLEDASEFLLKTGVVSEKDGSRKLLNPVLEHYVLAHALTLLEDRKSSSNKTPSDFLSGQELMVFRYLLENRAQIISKDKIAEIIWGNEWEAKYSDWAIDKLVSNLRKKLEDNHYKKTVKAFKGKGIQLV